jgi:hypothetical protein
MFMRMSQKTGKVGPNREKELIRTAGRRKDLFGNRDVIPLFF